MNIAHDLADTVTMLNDNQGVVSVAIFTATLTLGWVTGVFSALRRKPKFEIALLQGPTFCCTFLTGGKHDAFEVHRTGFALYLSIANIGSAPSDISKISLGYHWDLKPFSRAWFKHTVGWFWLTNQAAALSEFQINIGENIKLYPFLFQRSFLSGSSTNTFLDVGRSTNGVIYFEQSDSWGGSFPKLYKNTVSVKIRVHDVFGKYRTLKGRIPAVSLDYARKFNPSFGRTLAELHGTPLPFDFQTGKSDI